MIPGAVPVLLEAALRALAAAVVLWGCMRLLRVENVLAQKAAWGVVLAAALAMPLLMRIPLLPAWAAIRVPAIVWHRTAAVTAEPAAAARVAAAPAVQYNVAGRDAGLQDETDTDEIYRYSAPAISNSKYDAEPRSAPAAPAVTAPVVHASTPAASVSPHRLAAYGWLAYLCVTAALLLRLLVGLCSSLRLWMQAGPVEIAPQVEMPAAAIAVRASRRIASPVNIGSGIVLPADYASWDEEKLRVVLAHEGSHVRQRDFYLQLAAGLYAAVTWFSPLGWWLKRKLSELGEAISDRAGMEAAASPTAYAQLLLEFAALPRPAYTGVAMAHSSNLSERIERLLNDSSFRRAFTGGRRALLVLVPAVLFATAALVRVQAAQLAAQQPSAVLKASVVSPQQPSAQSSDQSAAPAAAQSGQSHPDEAQVSDDAQQPPAPQAAPEPHPAPAPPSDDGAPAPTPAAPPAPSIDVTVPATPAIHVEVPAVPEIHVEVPAPPMLFKNGDDFHYSYHFTDGDPYVIVGDAGSKSRFAGDWDGERQADVDKARSMAHGHFLLFRHDGKTYFIDDPATVAQIEAMQKPMEALGEQMRALGKQMREDGQQQREEARKERQAAENIPAPDLTRQMAELNAAVAALKAEQGGTITREQLGEIQRKLSEVQRQLINAEIKVNVSFDKDFMGKWGAEQGKFGQQMGEMGKQMGQMARENDQKIKSIIDEGLKSGKAKPVN
jgi:beta-lactamase regulating signal transducer with metallopeptidase domain